MEAEKVLRRGRKLAIEIRIWEERLEEEKRYTIDYSLSSPQLGKEGSSGNSAHWASFEKQADRSVDNMLRIKGILQRKNEELDEILILIQEVEKPEHVSLLQNRYIKGLSWRQTKKAMEADGYFYSENYLKIRMKEAALSKFSESMKCKIM